MKKNIIRDQAKVAYLPVFVGEKLMYLIFNGV